MSNSIYNILNNFNKVAQEPAKPATQTNKPKTKLQESVEGVLSEKYMGFKKVAAAAKAGGAENPEAVAASIGRKKYGKEKFQKAATAGKKLGESHDFDKVLDAIAALYGDDIWDNDAMQDLANDLDQANPTDRELDFIIAKGKLPRRLAGIQFSAGDNVRFGEGSDPFANVNPRVEKPTISGTNNKAKSGYYPPAKPPVQKLAKPIDEADMDEGAIMEYDRSLAIPASKALIAALPRMSKLGYTQEDQACVEKVIKFFQRGDTHKARRYQKISRGCTINASNFIDEILSDANINPDAKFQQPFFVDPRMRDQGMAESQINELSPELLKRARDKAGMKYAQADDRKDKKASDKYNAQDDKFNSALRKKQKDMEEGNEFSGNRDAAIKAGQDEFEVDGKRYPVKESAQSIKQLKSKKSKNKVEETIQSLLSAGFTKEQIIEGWDDMMKSVEKSRRDDKGTGKFDNKKISTGTVYTRKYNPKTGEADDSENVTKEKRGRGRPKKNAFESRYTTVNKMITESFLSENGAAPIQPKDAEKFMKSSDPKIFDKLTGNKTQTPAGGTIKQGIWTADAPKAGQKPVPVPQNPEMAKEGTPDLNTTLGIKTTPNTKATPYKGPDLNTTVGIKSTPASAPASTSTAPDINKLTIDAMNKTNETAKEDEEMQEALNQMRRIAGLPVIESKADKKADDDYDNDGKIESGKDEYLGSKIRAARDAGKLGDDKEKVDECSSPMGNGMMGQESDGKMNITTNMNSDGHKSVTITADGDAASDLMQMLKLAGMQGGDVQQQEPVGVMVVSNDEDEVEENLEIRANPAGASSAEQAKAIGAQSPQQGGKEPNYAYKIGEEEVDEAKDERYHASTTPDEQVSSVQAQTKGGNGDVAGQEKRMRKGGYQFGDNNLAMKDVYEGIDGLEAMGRKLYKEYQSIKVQK